MSTQDDKFLKSLRATFKVEADEHLDAIASGLLLLKKPISAAEQQTLVETVFRAAHSLKGAARAVNLLEVESVCQVLESIFAAWKRKESTPSPQILDLVHQALDDVSHTISDPEPQSALSLSLHVQALRNRASQPSHSGPAESGIPIAGNPGEGPPLSVAAEKTPAIETVRIAVAKLDARLLEAEEMLAAKLITRQSAADLRELADRLAEWEKAWARVQPEARAMRQLLDRPEPATAMSIHPSLRGLVDFVDWNHDYLRSLEGRLVTLCRKSAQDNLFLGKLVDDLLEDSKNLLMLPLSTFGSFLKRLVRDLCRDQGKQADLVIFGEEVEIDRRILELMKDPLTHLIRNCVDHGIEAPEQRQRLGKVHRATIALTVSLLSGDKVELVLTDDGAGIDVEKVKQAAVKRGVVSSQETRSISDEEALRLIFRSDVSTSAIITQLSGRGLGLAIVQEQTEKLGGKVSVETVRHAGTSIRITLPIALRRVRGILVEAARQLFVVPTTQVERVSRFKPEDVQTVAGGETLVFDGRAVAVTALATVLELSQPEENAEHAERTPVIILRVGEQRTAFAVDAVLGEQEILVKRLGKPLLRVRNVAGATVLGSGRVVPILNAADLLESAKNAVGLRPLSAAKDRVKKEAKSILVVEDSITSRMLIKGILESAGYQVKTAVDGVDAFTLLRSERFDLVISDVEMPRMNGFDLAAKIRLDKKLAELPIILVTALERREDRERGIDVGANAYLVKSNFDQSNLLEVIRRLT